MVHGPHKTVGAALFVSEGRLEKHGAGPAFPAGSQQADPAEGRQLAGAFEGYRVIKIINPGAESKWDRICLLLKDS